ncbi:MAG: phosphatidate cytidylyltransferase [Mycoplasmataceae bacterium]|nr:phosphatidate cytidylyltransferase [Mycoplasmataceae bacterium]
MLHINKLDQNKKNDFKIRMKSVFLIIVVSLVLIVFCVLADPRHKNRTNWDNNDWYDGFAFYLPLWANFIFALILVFCLSFIIYQIAKELEGCFIKSQSKKNILFIFFFLFLSFILPSGFLLFVVYFGKSEKWFNIDSAVYVFLFICSLSFIFPLHSLVKKSNNSNKHNNFFFPFITILISFFISGILYFTIIRGIITTIAILAICFMCDSGGYIFGVLFGKHKMAPTISPKKTWEGLAGSYFCSIIIVCLLLYLFSFGEHSYNLQSNFLGNQWDKYSERNKGIAPNSFGWWMLSVGLILVLSTISVIGDLLFSWFKRVNKIKDFSNFIKGHGGILDRVDSWVLVISSFFILSLIISSISTYLTNFSQNRIFNYCYIY